MSFILNIHNYPLYYHCRQILEQYNALLQTIAEDLYIYPGTLEDKDDWQQWILRIIYSALGHISLASLYDLSDEDNEGNYQISVIHLKNRIKKHLQCFYEMYSDVFKYFEKNHKTSDNFSIICDVFIEEIYGILSKTGHVYHKANYLSPVPSTEVYLAGGIKLLRGQALGLKVYRSGLGAYLNLKQKFECCGNLYDMFHLPTESLEIFWNYIVKEARFSPTHITDLEFLKHENFESGHWGGKQQTHGISLARTKNEGERLYYLYQMINGSFMFAQLPNWLFKDFYRYRIANACLIAHHCLKSIKFKDANQIVYIRFDYILPDPERYFMKLYSWPYRFEKGKYGVSEFKRWMTKTVFEAIRPLFEKLGYTFEELNTNDRC